MMPAEIRSDLVSEAELRRYLRFASVLLGTAELSPLDVEQRLLTLRRARHWLRAVLLGVDQLVREAECIPDTVDDPLTFVGPARTIGVES